ncbi:uncharacterized protein TNCV_4326511 [Trichonephila clavipes]|nr:uncharacterized protein TNCV_4326511 [Trichonephila clavipes]
MAFGSYMTPIYSRSQNLPGKRDRSTIYRLNLIKLCRRKPELANLVMENSSEGIDSEILYSVKLFMDIDFQGILRKSQLYSKLPPDRSSYLRMINAKKKGRFLPDPGTIVLRQKDINLITGKPFRIKTCCSSQMLINSLREDAEYLLDLGVNGMGQSNRTLPVVWLGRVNRYPYPRIKCVKYRNLNQVTRAEIYLSLKRESFVGKNNAASWVNKLTLLKWLSRVGSEVGLTKAGVHYRLFSVWTLVPVRLGKQLSDNSTVDEIASEAADCRLTYTMANCPQRR